MRQQSRRKNLQDLRRTLQRLERVPQEALPDDRSLGRGQGQDGQPSPVEKSSGPG